MFRVLLAILMAISTASGVERWAADTQRTINLDAHYRPFPKQALFHSNPAKYRLYGGGAGPGKSAALLMEAVIQANEVPEGSKVATLLLRRTVPQLEKSLLTRFRQMVPKELYRGFNDQKKIVTWHNNAITAFGSMQHEASVWEYQGGEYRFIGFDELTQFSAKQWFTLSAWNRCPVAFASMAGATNPIGPGAAFCKALWIDKKPLRNMDDEQKRLYNPKEYAFIPALISDNPVYASDPDYLATLAKLPAKLRVALLQGRWDVALGAYYDIWDPAEMTFNPGDIEIPRWAPRWIGMDWGFGHEAAVMWNVTLPGGLTVTYKELVIDRTGPANLGKAIVAASRDHSGRPERIQEFHLSWDAFHKKTDEDPIAMQIWSELKKAKLENGHNQFAIPVRATTDVIGREMLLYDLLQQGKWKISTACPRLIEVMPLAQRDEEKVEEITKFDGDDPLDAAAYGIYGRLKPKQAPRNERVKDRIEKQQAGLAAEGAQPLQGTELYLAVLKANQAERSNTRVRIPKRWRGSR